MQEGEEDAASLGQSGQLIRFRMQICGRNASSSFKLQEQQEQRTQSFCVEAESMMAYASRRYLPCTVRVFQSEPRSRIMSGCSDSASMVCPSFNAAASWAAVPHPLFRQPVITR
jgi:hypothetical protein